MATTTQDGYAATDAETQAKVKAMQAQATASGSGATAAPTLSPEDTANAAKYSTPLPPNDPASLRGSRQDPNYLGPTNFGKIQQSYTPYQIEQATTRNAQGDIFWKEGVDINKIPPAANGTGALTPPKTTDPLSTDNASTSGVNMSSGGLDSTFGRQQTEAAGKYLVGIQSTIDGLLATQQKMYEDQKKEAEIKVGSLMDRLRANLDGTQYKKQLDRDRQLFEVEKNINTLNVIREKLSGATSALESGLIYEEGRPVRMSLLTGRMSELKKQGIAQINALSSAAEVVKGNIDIARAYADDSLNAIKADNAEKNAALNTLLDLENAKLIKLTAAEKDTIDSRRKLLEDESARLEKDKDSLFDLAVKYPSAFAQGGVSFLDDPATALKKMLPKMAADEKQQYDLDIAQAQASLAATNRSNRGGSGGAAGTGGVSEASDYIAWLKTIEVPDEEAAKRGLSKARKLSPEEIKADVYKTFGSSLKTTEIDRVMTDILGKEAVQKTLSASQQVAEIKNQTWLDQYNAGEIDYDPSLNMTIPK